MLDFLFGYMLGSSNKCSCDHKEPQNQSIPYDDDLEITDIVRQDIKVYNHEGTDISIVNCVTEVAVKSKYADRHVITYSTIMGNVRNFEVKLLGKRTLGYYNDRVQVGANCI